MSGGVDSSVAAALLVHQGYEVIGMMLRLWTEPGKEGSNRCCTPEAMALARRVCARLGIPFYAIDAQEVFYNQVVTSFIDGYAQGITPNPCLVCNRQVRWDFLLKRALALEADYMATGHYARASHAQNDSICLMRAVDRQKDQSYVLHVLDQEQLSHALFPIGEFTKPQVRQLARDYTLPVADRQESQDLCFLADEDYREFLKRYSLSSSTRGPIQNLRGKILGTHQGLASYTIGQRKGLGIASPQPMYVLRKDIENNILIVGGQEELGIKELIACEVNWISGTAPASPFRAQVKIRYKASDAWGKVFSLGENDARVLFDEPLRDITPGQAAVFYEGDVCLGGGIIQ